MSYAKSTTEALQAAAREQYRRVYAAGQTYHTANKAVLGEGDVIAAMGRMIDLVLAAEDMEKLAKAASEALRVALQTAMAETNATGIGTDHHQADLRRAKARIEVRDLALVEPEFMTQPTPHPDKVKALAAAKKGVVPPGFEIIRPNHQVLYITPIAKDAAA
jgi:hypothetical protein